jgi:osmotically-inducible protein OsmY
MRRKARQRRQILASLIATPKSPAGTSPMPADLPQLDDRVQTALWKNLNLPKRNLRIEASDGRVTLHGTVHSYYQKQMAQEALRRVAGVSEIENHLEVNWAAAS